MTPREITEAVALKFGVLMYEGYKADETTFQTYASDGEKVFWPKEQKQVLSAYGNKAGIRKSMDVEEEDIDPIELTIDLPTDFRAIETCHDRSGIFIKTKQGTRTEGEDTIKTLKFLPLVGLDEITYPISFRYFLNLSAVDRETDLPESCEFGLIIDYLEAIVGLINAQWIAAMEMNDTFDMQQREYAEYQQQKTEVEEKLTGIKILPSSLATC
jgi:hypothetical protein